jgi:transcriptional regulator with XRE-family HTH domain
MDDVRIGAAIRVMRTRKRWRQADLARAAGISRVAVSRLERGGLARESVGDLRAVAAALGLRLDVRLAWPGGDLDRVVNAAHAALHESVARALATLGGWTWMPEVSFSVYGERGVVDILAWHAPSRSLLIIELKTTLVDPQELVATMDVRRRLGMRIARERGWDPVSVSTWVVLADGPTNRRRVVRHSGLLRQAFPSDGRSVRHWLRRPVGTLAALSFWSAASLVNTRRVPDHIRRVRRDPSVSA